MGACSRASWRWLEIASCIFCFAVVASAPTFSQQDEVPAETQAPVFRAEHNEVEVVVTVRDSNGQPVTNLQQSDFEIRDNGKLQSISNFSIQGALSQKTPEPTPVQPNAVTASTPQAVSRQFVALFFDDVHTDAGDFKRVQKAAEQFVQQSLRHEDRIGIFKTSENGEVTFTNDEPKLVAAIEALRVHPAKNASTVTQCPRITNYEAYVIVNRLDSETLTVVARRLQDCICPPPADTCPKLDDLKGTVEGYAQEAWLRQENASQKLLTALDLAVRALGTMPGRRMLVLSSSGFLSGSLQREVDRLIDNALRGGVVINALSAKGLYAQAPGGTLSEQNLEGTSNVLLPQTARYEDRQFFIRMEAENEAMADLAHSTGGKLFKNNNDFLRGFNEVAAPEVSYVLAFSPHPLQHDGKFHNLTVEIKRNGTFGVYARKGYFAPTQKEAKAVRDGAAPALPAITSHTRIPELQQAEAKAASPAAAETVPPTKAPGDTPALPAKETEVVAAKAALPEPQPATAVDARVATSSIGTQPGPADASADAASELAFLTRASREVEHYTDAFADLTADETRVMQSYDEQGFAEKRRSMQSALVVYRLRNDPMRVLEYRDVISMDGHEIKGHAARAENLWREVAEAHSTQEEAKRIAADGERYDIGFAERGFTLFEGLPLRARCARDFVFREVRHDNANGRPVRVFAYRQAHPCDVVTYHFTLPPQFADAPLMQAGELALDVETSQVVREERSVYLGDPGKKPPRVAHIVLDYVDSPFGILVPKAIVIETFAPRKNVNLTSSGFGLFARTVLTYGPFSRFEVSVGEKVSDPAR